MHVYMYICTHREVINTRASNALDAEHTHKILRTRARNTRDRRNHTQRNTKSSREEHISKQHTMFTPHTRQRSFAPPSFLTPPPFFNPSGTPQTRPKLSLHITSNETCTRYSPSKIPACEFLSPATQRNTRYNATIESSEEESSGDEAQEVVVRRSGRRRSGTVRFEEVVSVRIIEPEGESWEEDRKVSEEWL